MGVARKSKSRFRVGDQVAFLYGPRMVRGEIIENRGPLGVYGEPLYLVRTMLDPDSDSQEAPAFEVQEQDLKEPTAVDQQGSPGSRIAYQVTYVRHPGSNAWSASVTRDRVHEGVRARGAIAYTTSRRAGRTRDDEIHAIVSVFLEPRESESERDRLAEARRLADQMFSSLHPEAVVSHPDSRRDKDPD